MITSTHCATTEQPSERWTDLVALLNGWRCAWTDLDGLHVDVPPPATTPIAGHLWAWTAGSWIRVRIDHRRWVAGALFRSAPPDSPLWRDQETVAVTTDIIRNWSYDRRDGRIAQLRIAAGTLPATMCQLVPVRPTTAVYIGSVDSLAG